MRRTRGVGVEAEARGGPLGRTSWRLQPGSRMLDPESWNGVDYFNKKDSRNSAMGSIRRDESKQW